MRRSGLLLTIAVASVLGSDPAALAAQATPAGGPPGRNDFRVGLSLGHEQAREELLAPFRWNGPEITIDLGWELERPRASHRIELTVPFAVVENRYGHAGFILGATLDYTYQRATAWTVAEGAVSFGGQLRYDLHDGFYESWDQEHAYWLTVYSLAPAAGWSGAPGSRLGRLSASITVPMLALVSRPPRYRTNKIDDLTKIGFHFLGTQKHLELATPPDYIALLTRVSYRGAWRGFDLSYELEYATYVAPERLSTLSNRVMFSHAF